ncbi:CRISPR-associated endonuclease Cas2 [Micrococcoides hystricis]|uniref:CRISPR-associated endoribonuclease Cas2 n=2 Tax=Micrococcoides hystricis TaxID=1572761 RepID=A0ABV6PAN0_9MICC
MLTMFDLPVKTAVQRRDATEYRKSLVNLGFAMVQLSVYSKYLPTAAQSTRLLRLITYNIPAGGAVRVYRLSDTQWHGSTVFFGDIEIEPEKEPPQLFLF